MSFLTVTEYETRRGEGPLGSIARAQVEAFIDDATDLIRLVVKDAFDITVPGSVKSVVYKMVRRGIENPLSASSESIGDYARGEIPDIYMTGKEVGIVRKAAGLPWLVEIGLSVPLPERLLRVLDDDITAESIGL